MIRLFPKGWQFLPIYFLVLIHIWLVVVTKHMVSTFSMFWDGRFLKHFPRGGKKYNDMKNIMKLIERSGKRYGGREKLFSINSLTFFIGWFGSVLV